MLLNDKVKKKTLVSLYNPKTKERWEEVVIPIKDSELSALLYERWVKQRAADVETCVDDNPFTIIVFSQDI